MHHDGRQNSEACVDKKSCDTVHCILAQIDSRLVTFESRLHEIDAEKQKPEPGENCTEGFPGSWLLEIQYHAKDKHRQSKGRKAHFHTDGGEQPGAGRSAEIGAEDNADTRDQRKQAGAQKRDRDHRYQGTGLHDGGTDDAKTEAFRNRIGCTTQHALEKTTGKLAKPVLQREHAEQKNGNAGGNLFELWAQPERKGEDSEDQSKKELAIVHWDSTSPFMNYLTIRLHWNHSSDHPFEL